MGFPFYNPSSIALLNRASYLTLSEFKNAPTALDLDNLVDGGTDVDNDAELAQILARSSSAMDQYVFPDGTGGTLAASIDTDTASVRPDNDGYLRLVCRFKPVIAVTALAMGPSPSQLQALDPGLVADLEVGESMRVLYVPAHGAAGTTGSTLLGGPGRGRGGRIRVQWSYVDGYPHALLAEDVDVDATTLELTSTLGMQPGTGLTIYDGGRTENVVVATVTSSTVVELAAGVQFAHEVPDTPDAISVSALPGSVKQAGILIASSFIKERGDNAYVLPDSASSLESIARSGQGGSDDAARAMELLRPFQIVAPRAS